MRVPEDRVREFFALRAAVRELREDEAARELREREEEPPERDDLLDELRFDLPLDPGAEARRLERAAVRGELFVREREVPVRLLFFPVSDELLRALADRDAPRWEDRPRSACCAVSRLTSLLKLLFPPPAVLS